MIPIILSGGSGERLWPVSKQSCPKQFVNLMEPNLFSQTFQRVLPFGSPWTITTKDLNVLTVKEYEKNGGDIAHILCEPQPKNTAAAIAYACKRIETLGKEHETVGIFPSDHHIPDTALFQETVLYAQKSAAQGSIICLGINPTYPATAYGYIQVQQPTTQASPLSTLKIEQFVEKPSLENAQALLNQKQCYWNSGMFIFQASTMISLFKKHLPEMWELFENYDDISIDEIYQQITPISIDYGIIEKSSNLLCVPSFFEWFDLGSWDAVSDVIPGHNQTVSIDSKNNYVFSKLPKQYSMIGVEDTIIVDTPGSTLICKKGQTQKTKQIVTTLKDKKIPEATEHNYQHRPWGTYEVLHDTDNFKSKILAIDPGKQISYQSHQKRSEHWIVTQGQAEITIGKEKYILSYGQSTFVPAGIKHRVRNHTDGPLQIIEVQVGSYFGEDDIERFKDDFGRV